MEMEMEKRRESSVKRSALDGEKERKDG